MNAHPTAPSVQMFKYIVGKWISKPLYVIAGLGIADMLSHGPESVRELARVCKVDEENLYRLLRGLASVGIFQEIDQKRFQLTPMAECLQEGAMRSMVLMFNADWNDRAWLYLNETVKSGTTAFERAHGMPLFQWLQDHADAAEKLNAANAAKAATSHRAILDAYDFTLIRSLVDVGGGNGALMAELLEAVPHLRGTVAEIPALAEQAELRLKKQKLETRGTVEICDMFQRVPPGHDAILLSNILHDWPDERCRVILRHCRRAMRNHTKLLIVEMIVPPGNEPSPAKLLDLEMMVITGGRERTLQEYKTLLRDAGLTHKRTLASCEYISIIEAVRQ